MNYWQIAAGAHGRDYAEAFLRYGMAFVGGLVQVETMHRVEAGDRVILKRGMSQVVAAGEVVERNGSCKGQGDKKWLRDFDGWDLEAYCYLSWHRPAKPVETHGLTRATIQNVHKQHLQEIADDIIANVPAITQLDPEPPPTHRVEDEEILEFLIVQGLRPSAAEELTLAINRIRRLAKYYYERYEDWREIREHETRTFMVVPLLIALGWAEQQLKIEFPVPKTRGRVDIAGFRGPFPGKNGECVLLIETKGFSEGLDYAPEQARRYADYFPQCRVILVSNGYCYKAFTRDESNVFSLSPSAYLNLLNPRDRYPLDPGNVDGCLEVLRLLLPLSLA